jgi:GT2 family glycosyltransferase
MPAPFTARAVTAHSKIDAVTMDLATSDAADVGQRIGIRPYRGWVIIILNYGGIIDTRECLDSLQAAGVDPAAILVVDNASPGGDADQLHESYPAVPIVRAEANYGFSGANNIGATLAQAVGATHVLLLNNDTTVAPGFLDAFADYYDAHPDVVLLNPKIVWYHAPKRIWFAGGSYSRWLAFPRDLARNHPDSAQYDTEQPISFATGCALGVRLDRVPDGQLFVPEFFGYAEDLELTLRVLTAGGGVMYAPVTVVRHKEGRTFSAIGRRSLTARLSTRNVIYVARRCLRWYHWPTASVAYTVGFAGRLALAFALRRDWPAIGAVVRGSLQGLLDPLPTGLVNASTSSPEKRRAAPSPDR